MRTETEIKQLPLEEQQKLVIELRQVPVGDKAYPNAKAIIELITGNTKKWKEPVQVEVKNTADHAVTVDGAVIAKDATGKVYPWQLAALARFLEPVGKAAALLLFCLLLGLGLTASAQTQAYVVGSSGTYNVVSIAGLNGGTNNIIGTNSTFATATYITNTAVSPVWVVSNGVSSVTFTTNTTSIATNTPGVVSLVNSDSADIFWGFALTGAGSGNATATFDYSDDLVNWRLSAITATLAANGTTFVGTNISLSLFTPGYIRLNTVSYPSVTAIQTNVVFELAKKPGRTGP
jgi:hypothetical protein